MPMATIAEALAIAMTHHQAGRLPSAQQIYRQILQAEPDHPDALHLLGLIAQQVGQPAVAVELMGRAIAVNPRVAIYHCNLGTACRNLGRLDEALDCFQRAVELNPEFAEAHYNRANTFQEQGRLDEAAASFRQTIRFRPDFAEAHSNLGVILQQQGQTQAAIACFQQALRFRPEHVEAYNNLGNAWYHLGQFDEATRCFQQALQLRPEFAEGQNNLGNVLKDQGLVEEALACYRRAAELAPAMTAAHSDAVACEHYRPGVTLARLAEVHAGWDQRHAAPLRSTWRAHANSRDPERTLRLGFVSPDLARHPVGYFLVRTLEALRAEPCEVICYWNGSQRDEMTGRLQAAATAWREVHGLPEQALAEEVRGDAIDILFDLAGHTANGRLLVFARKPAPLEIAWIGYEGTTGLAAMDYLVADRHVVPPGAEPFYREQVLRMPDGYLCYDPPAEAPGVGPLPARECGWPTFGCFNNLAKITPQVAALWGEILRKAPQARLMLKARGLDAPATARRYRELFAAQGVSDQRLELSGWSPYAEMLAKYHEVDVALDPFPFSGSATTCEALWMGVPVVTCPGETFASRHALSHLATVGLTETIARDWDEYVKLAVALAGDLPRLAGLRAQLRAQMAGSPLCDGPRFARNLMALLRGVWRRWAGADDP
jgi:predicted O-linked N-acetylglucosamine transferase (SPINDLY family)